MNFSVYCCNFVKTKKCSIDDDTAIDVFSEEMFWQKKINPLYFRRKIAMYHT